MSHRNLFTFVAVLTALCFATSAHAAVTIITETYDTDVAAFPAGDASYSDWTFTTNNGSTASVVSGELIIGVSNSPIGIANTTQAVAGLTNVTVKAEVLTTGADGNSEAGLLIGDVGWGIYDDLVFNRLRKPDTGVYFGFDAGTFTVTEEPVEGTTYLMTMTLNKTGADSWDLTVAVDNLTGDPAFAFTNTIGLTDAQATGGVGVINRVGTWTYGILGQAEYDNFMAIDNNAVIPAPAALPAGLALIGILAARRRRK